MTGCCVALTIILAIPVAMMLIIGVSERFVGMFDSDYYSEHRQGN